MRGDNIARLYSPHLKDKLLAISFITVGEMYYGAEKKQWAVKKRKELETHLKNFVVIPYDHQIAQCYGKVVAERERKGRPILCADAWIAACAIRHSISLVTHDLNDFKDIEGLNIITENK